MKTTDIGLLLGALLGAVLVFRGLGEMLIVGLAAAIGWVVAAVIAGELDVGALLERSSRTRSEPRR
ncbi:MAG: DUF2273 domain-containing protein [Acidimicrobiia bacterium]